MLTEQFIASIGAPLKVPGTNVAKDAAIFVHEFQPLAAERTVFKKSATHPNCLAVSETHVFAAQADKGVVNVYNREYGKQEVTVPFAERISSITLACEDSVLILGTVEGSIFMWETTSGRQIRTSQAHLQSVTALTVDSTSNFLLSASKDSTLHVWSIPALLSFSRTGGVSPLRTFSSHNSEITVLAVSQSASNSNFAVSASTDRTCLVWDYHTNNPLRMYLLPAVPLCISLDPAGRAAYVGYEDGSLQQLDLYASSSEDLDAVQSGSNPMEPVQPPKYSRWKVPDVSLGALLSLSVSFDGSTVISGHQSGSVLIWDVARGSFLSTAVQAPLPGPVNNLQMLPVSGFGGAQIHKRTMINSVIKPNRGGFDSAEIGTVPGNYALSVQFPSEVGCSRSGEQTSRFQAALAARTFPMALLDEGLCELAAWGKSAGIPANGNVEAIDEDYMALDDASAQSGQSSLQEENANLKLQLESLRRVQQKSFEKMDQLSEERKALIRREQKRLAQRSGKGANGVSKGTLSEDDMT